MSRVDVFVTCYNYGRYLRQCATSVLDQSHRDLRLILVDDASEDDTPGVSAEIAAADARVEVVRHSANLGHIATYNRCIDQARSALMLLLSADDFLLPGALDRASRAFDRDPVLGLVFGACPAWSEGDPMPAAAADDGSPVPLTPAKFVPRLAAGNVVATATAVVRTEVQQRLGHYRPELPHAGDLEMWLRFALQSRIAYLQQAQAVYRRHDRNMSLAYDTRADLDQRMASFRLHYDGIERGLAGGTEIAARIRRWFEMKARELDVPQVEPVA